MALRESSEPLSSSEAIATLESQLDSLTIPAKSHAAAVSQKPRIGASYGYPNSKWVMPPRYTFFDTVEPDAWSEVEVRQGFTDQQKSDAIERAGWREDEVREEYRREASSNASSFEYRKRVVSVGTFLSRAFERMVFQKMHEAGRFQFTLHEVGLVSPHENIREQDEKVGMVLDPGEVAFLGRFFEENIGLEAALDGLAEVEAQRRMATDDQDRPDAAYILPYQSTSMTGSSNGFLDNTAEQSREPQNVLLGELCYNKGLNSMDLGPQIFINDDGRILTGYEVGQEMVKIDLFFRQRRTLMEFYAERETRGNGISGVRDFLKRRDKDTVPECGDHRLATKFYGALNTFANNAYKADRDLTAVDYIQGESPNEWGHYEVKSCENGTNRLSFHEKKWLDKYPFIQTERDGKPINGSFARHVKENSGFTRWESLVKDTSAAVSNIT